MTLHYHFKKNVPVFVMLKDGTSFVAKWHESVRKHFRFTDRGPVRIKKVRFITFNKDRSPHNRKESVASPLL